MIKLYVKERKQFGKAIADFQGVQFQIARAATELEAARLMVYNAARLRDAGASRSSKEAAMGKLFLIRWSPNASARSRGEFLFGGHGFVKRLPAGEVLPRRQDWLQIYEGTSNLQLQTIAQNRFSGELEWMP